LSLFSIEISNKESDHLVVVIFGGINEIRIRVRMINIIIFFILTLILNFSINKTIKIGAINSNVIKYI